MLYKLVVSLAILGSASGLRTPAPTGATAPAAAPVGRRQAIATAFGAAAVLVADRASAYDAMPTVEADFAAMEKLRAERMAKSEVKTKELRM